MGASMALAGYTVTVPAGGEEALQVRGSSARVVSATADFRLGIDADASVPFAGGLAFTMPAGREFEQLRIINPNGGPVTVTILISAGEVHDARSTFAGTMNAAIVSMPAVTIAAGQSVGITGTPNVAVTSLPAVTITGTPNVNATITGTPNVNAAITGTPTVAVAVASAVITESPMPVDTVQKVVLWGDPLRMAACFQNLGPAVVRVGMSVTASWGIRLLPGQAVTLETSGDIRAICESGTASLTRTWVKR